MLGFREAAALLSDPLRRDHGFPVAAAVNATADAAAQLLIASSPAVFDPSATWGDATHAVFSQGQIERRTPPSAFLCGKANPYHWQEVKPPVAGDQAPPPLLDVGCCHVDVDALPKVRSGKRSGLAYQIARRPRQDAVGALLARLQLAMWDGRSKKGTGRMSESTADPSEASCNSLGGPARSATGELSTENDWDAIASKIATVPREYSPASSIGGTSHPGFVGASRSHPLARLCDGFAAVGGMWANPAEEPRPPRRGSMSVSPHDGLMSKTSSGGLRSSTSSDPHRSRTPCQTPCRA